MKEDIEILETLKEVYIKASECGLGYPSDNREDKRIAQAIENVLHDLKYNKAQFETQLREKLDLQANSIPISVIQNKIDELKLSGGSNGKDEIENKIRELTIEILQELLEERKTKQ